MVPELAGQAGRAGWCTGKQKDEPREATCSEWNRQAAVLSGLLL